MKRVADRKKKRREYLLKKGVTYIKVGLAATCYVPLAVATILLGLGSLYSWIAWMFWSDRQHPGGNHWDWFAIGLTVMALLAGCLWYLSGLFYERSLQDINEADYVPPITPTTLPDEEILVRGAESPATTSGTLLRAAKESDEVKAAELLRSGQSG